MSTPSVPPSGITPPAEPQPVAKVTAQGKLCLCLGNDSREIRVKYGDEALTDTYQLEKMASLINKHYDTRKLYDELFNKAGNKLTLASGGITNITGEKITASTKKFKKEEQVLAHHDRKLAELESSMKKSVAFGKEVEGLGRRYSDGVLKQAIGSITGQTGVDLKKAITGEFLVNQPQVRLLHAHHQEGLLTTLLALKNRPNLGSGSETSVADCRKEILKLLKDQYAIELLEKPPTDKLQDLVKMENLNQAKSEIKNFLTETLKVPNVDDELNLTQPISHYKLNDKEGSKSRLQLITEKIASLERQPLANDDQKEMICLQLYVLKNMEQLWKLYKDSPEPLQRQALETPEAHLVLEPDPDHPLTPPSSPASRPIDTPVTRQEKPITEPFNTVFEGFDQRTIPEKKEVLRIVVKSILTVEEIDEVINKHSDLLTTEQKQQLDRQKQVRTNFEILQTDDEKAKKASLAKLITLDLYPEEIDHIITGFRSLLSNEQYTSLAERMAIAVRKSRFGLQKLESQKPQRVEYVQPRSDLMEMHLEELQTDSAERDDSDEFTIDEGAFVASSETEVPELGIRQGEDETNKLGLLQNLKNKVKSIFTSRKPPSPPPLETW